MIGNTTGPALNATDSRERLVEPPNPESRPRFAPPPQDIQPTSLSREAMRRFRANRLAMASLLVLLALIAGALLANFLPLIDPTVNDPFNQDSFPSRLHLLGTDSSGHDL